MTKLKKVNKIIKTTIPFLALFGGQGFASSRNPLSIHSVRKNTIKPVIHIDHSNDLDITNHQILTKQTQSPFTAFTKKRPEVNTVKKTTKVTQAMAFLIKNNLLSSQDISTAQISGNIENNKIFADNWSFILNGNNGSSACVFGANYGNGNSTAATRIHEFVWGVNTNSGVTTEFFCQLNATEFYFESSTTVSFVISTNATNTNQIIGRCENFHIACDRQSLPVELQKFEIE